jgi:cob(I)alamin adenosyltransferase
MKNSKVQIYTGKGKGKTTAALGLCFRAMGRDLRAAVVQFRKGVLSGEHIQAERTGLPIYVCRMGRNAPPCSKPCRMLEQARAILAQDAVDILVLDEIMAAISRSCVSVEEILELVRTRPDGTELVLTGRNAPDELLNEADLVTSMEPKKHYFKDGTPARVGIEY